MSNEVRIVDPKTGGAKGTKPERFELVPVWAMKEVARVYGFGAKKYADHNWAKGYDWGLSIGALERHVAEFKSGNDNDDESKLHHLAHAAFHCLTLITYGIFGLGTDSRLKLKVQATPADPASRPLKVGDVTHGAGWFKRRVESISSTTVRLGPCVSGCFSGSGEVPIGYKAFSCEQGEGGGTFRHEDGTAIDWEATLEALQVAL